MSISYPSLGIPPVGNDVVLTVVPSVTNVVLSAVNLNRAPESLIINSSNKNLWVSFTGAAATTASPSIKVPANGGSMDIPGSYSGVINGIWEAAATGTAAVHEFSYS
jgi:hypothetical protein